MEKLLKGIYFMIYGYLNEAQARRDQLEAFISFAHNANYDGDDIKDFEAEYKKLSDEIQKLSNLAETVKNM